MHARIDLVGKKRSEIFSRGNERVFKCMCVCVCVRERERENIRVSVKENS